MAEFTEEQIIAKCAKIMALVPDGATEGERNAALGKVQAIMAKHQISERQIAGASLDSDEFIRDEISFEKMGPQTRRLMSLAMGIGRPLGLATGYNSSRYCKRVVFWGRRSTIEMAKMLYTSLSADALVQAGKLKARRSTTNEERPDRDDPLLLSRWATKGDLRAATQSVRMGFLEGYTNKITNRLYEQREAIDTEHDGTYLPMLMSDFQRAQAMSTARGSGSYTQSGSRQGQRLGREAASKASLGGTAMASAPRQITA